MTELEFTIPNQFWMSANDRYRHWAIGNERKKWLRAQGYGAALLDGTVFTRPVHVTAHIGYPTNGKADPSNAAPTLKALIDGMTSAGAWIDDDHTHLIGPDYRRDTVKAPRGYHTVRLEIVEVGA